MVYRQEVYLSLINISILKVFPRKWILNGANLKHANELTISKRHFLLANFHSFFTLSEYSLLTCFLCILSLFKFQKLSKVNLDPPVAIIIHPWSLIDRICFLKLVCSLRMVSSLSPNQIDSCLAFVKPDKSLLVAATNLFSKQNHICQNTQKQISILANMQLSHSQFFPW